MRSAAPTSKAERAASRYASSSQWGSAGCSDSQARQRRYCALYVPRTMARKAGAVSPPHRRQGSVDVAGPVGVSVIVLVVRVSTAATGKMGRGQRVAERIGPPSLLTRLLDHQPAHPVTGHVFPPLKLAVMIGDLAGVVDRHRD